MTIKQHGGVFGRNPTFNSVTASSVTVDGTAVPDPATIIVDSDVGTIASQDADSVNIDGGAIDGTPIGASSQSTGSFSADGAEALTANRNTDDGEIAVFKTDGTNIVGKISAITNNSIAIDGGGTTNNTGWAFSNPGVLPRFAGNLQDDRNDLGSNAYRMDDIYATNTTITTSDRNEKQDIEELSEAERRVAVACKTLVRKFRWIARVEEKGDNARIHFGVIAQDLQAAFEAEGLDAGRYAMFIRGTWVDEETGEERSRLGVRYSELLAFMIAAL